MPEPLKLHTLCFIWQFADLESSVKLWFMVGGNKLPILGNAGISNLAVHPMPVGSRTANLRARQVVVCLSFLVAFAAN